MGAAGEGTSITFMSDVTIIIPTYNRPDMLSRALDSVETQSYTQYSVVVVDDGDVKIAKDIVQSHALASRITYIETKKNTGGAATRNRGIEEVKTTYTAFLDDDDVWEKEKLSIQMNVFKNAPEKVGFVFSAVKNIYPHTEEITYVDEAVRDFRDIARRRFKGFLTSTLVVKTSLLKDVGGFDITLPSHQEADLIMRLSHVCEGVGVNQPLVLMRMSDVDDHIGGSPVRRITGREKVLKKHKDIYAKYPKDLAFHYFWLGIQYRDIHETRKAISYFLKSWHTGRRFRGLIHASILSIRYILEVIKKVFTDIFRPQHAGTLIRGMYFRKYAPSAWFQKEVTILDAGCGRGQYGRYIAKHNPRAKVIGIDILKHKEWSNEKEGSITFLEQDIHTIENESAYDGIVSIDVLEHVPHNKDVIKKFARALKSGGYLYLAVPCDETEMRIFPKRWFASFEEWEEEEHIGEDVTLNEWVELIKKEGMDIHRARHSFTFWGMFVWEVEFLLRGSVWGNRCNRILMPLYRLLGLLDIYVPIGKGDNVILAQKK